jgi:hypothetical protein
MKNTINSGSLQGLQAGQCLMIQARKVKGGKIQIEFGEIIDSGRTINPLGMFNKSDDRFNVGNKARRAWLTAESKDASKLLGVDFSDAADWSTDQLGNEVLELNVLNPQVDVNGTVHSLKVQITETTTPTEYQAANLQTAAKRKGKDGDFITHQGMYVFANTQVVFDKANHTFLEADVTVNTGKGIPAGVDLNTGELF